MIVLQEPSGWALVHQADHAAMSAAAARAWKPPSRLPDSLWPRFIEAVEFHDDGWYEEEAFPAVDDGGKPHDFQSVPAAVHVPIWRRSLEKTRKRHPYVTLLVALHGRRLYTQSPRKPTSEDQELSERFLRDLEEVIEAETARLRRGDRDESAAATPGNLEAASRLLSFLDGLSLMMLGALEVQPRTDPLCFGDRESPFSLRKTADALALAPWPFPRRRLTLKTPAYRIAKARFESAADLGAAVATAPRISLARQIVCDPSAAGDRGHNSPASARRLAGG